MPRHCQQVTHLAYADDIVIFTTTRKGSLRQLSGCIDSFLAASGLSLNQQKSSAIHAKSAQRADRARVKRILGFGSARLPLLYLGCWLDCGRSRGRLFLPLIDRIKARITAWQHNFLSLGGKKVLINSVLSSMSGFIAAALSPPKSRWRPFIVLLHGSSGGNRTPRTGITGRRGTRWRDRWPYMVLD
ncbi:hypothetical protein HPP92_020139 [Vanilla planifolia]|uniref:Reverse transcriptase domain-containing protein n=1 Tax=Vanilla planifolia TaxID=51239 RepID=A0A835Q832_VANPL|nr:hypothetical protein HPP92_020139 [Vanilla planifolia]